MFEGGFNVDLSAMSPAFNALLANYQRYSDLAYERGRDDLRQNIQNQQLSREAAKRRMDYEKEDRERRAVEGAESKRKAEGEARKAEGEKRAFIMGRNQQMRDLHGTYSRTAVPFSASDMGAEGLSEFYGRGLPHAMGGGAMGGGSAIGSEPERFSLPLRSPIDVQYDRVAEEDRRRTPTQPAYNLYLPGSYGG